MISYFASSQISNSPLSISLKILPLLPQPQPPHPTMSTLLQDVLRQQSHLPAEGLAAKLQNIHLNTDQTQSSSSSNESKKEVAEPQPPRTPSPERNSSDDELINVVSASTIAGRRHAPVV